MKRKRTKQATLSNKPVDGSPAPVLLGIGWYRADQWAHLREVAADTPALHATYSEWEADATEKLRQFAAMGMRAQAVPIDLDELVAWCRAQNVPLDGAARSQFVTHKMQQLNKQRNM